MNHNLSPAFFRMLELEENDVRAKPETKCVWKRKCGITNNKNMQFLFRIRHQYKMEYETFLNKRLKLLKISPYGWKDGSVGKGICCQAW